MRGAIQTDIEVEGVLNISSRGEENISRTIYLHNTFMSDAKNYLRDALCLTGNFDPIETMRLVHSGGTVSRTLTPEIVGTGVLYKAEWSNAEGPYTISSFKLCNDSGTEYARVEIPGIVKGYSSFMNVEWTLTIR